MTVHILALWPTLALDLYRFRSFHSERLSSSQSKFPGLQIYYHTTLDVAKMPWTRE